MNTLKAGFTGGLVATIVLSAILVAKGMMGLMPELDVIKMLSAMMGTPAAIGWVAHFMIGTILWGGLFALLYDHVPGGGAASKGIAFGVAVWLAMMIAVMPMAGAGLFGLSLGIMAPVMTLVLHVIFGAVLGAVYNAVAAPKPTAA